MTDSNDAVGEKLPTQDDVIAVLKTILDPELYLDIWTLGLIYGITIEEGKLSILMTFTSPACPAGPYLIEEVKEKTKAIAGIEETAIEITFQPPWEPSEDLKAMLGLL